MHQNYIYTARCMGGYQFSRQPNKGCCCYDSKKNVVKWDPSWNSVYLTIRGWAVINHVCISWFMWCTACVLGFVDWYLIVPSKWPHLLGISRGFSSDMLYIACYLPCSQIVPFRSLSDNELDEYHSLVLPDLQYPCGLEELIRDVLVLGNKDYPLHKLFRSA